jgi:hypothetical protein
MVAVFISPDSMPHARLLSNVTSAQELYEVEDALSCQVTRNNKLGELGELVLRQEIRDREGQPSSTRIRRSLSLLHVDLTPLCASYPKLNTPVRIGSFEFLGIA